MWSDEFPLWRERLSRQENSSDLVFTTSQLIRNKCGYLDQREIIASCVGREPGLSWRGLEGNLKIHDLKSLVLLD